MVRETNEKTNQGNIWLAESTEKANSRFTMKVFKASSFVSVGCYAKSLAIVTRERLRKDSFTIAEEDAQYWAEFIKEYDNEVYNAAYRGVEEASKGGNFELNSITMSLSILSNVIRERKPTSFEEVAFWCAVYGTLNEYHPMSRFDIRQWVATYAQWIWRLNVELRGVGIAVNIHDTDLLHAENVRYVTFAKN